ncbi:MAG TPA: hypothetical protein VGL39_11820 [Jatrophihabitantaceae bacterium]
MAGTFALRRPHGAPKRWSAGAAAGRAATKAATKAALREMQPRDADRFLDIVVMISVALFMLLATGVGVLVLQHSMR